MKTSIEPIPIFQLPDWARWFAWIDLSQELKIQLLDLKYPRWGSAFYPIYLNQDHQPLFDLPKDLSVAANDGRIWQNPSQVYYSQNTSQILVDHRWEGDHPKPAGASRLLISPPDYTVKIIEHDVASYGSDYKDPAGEIVPLLSDLIAGFEARKVIPFNEDGFLQEKPKPLWQVEKKRQKTLKKS